MNFHEYQAKEIFASYGVPVPAGIVARTVDEALNAAETLGGNMWVVKAQVHAGGRGKAGGVKLAKSMDEVREYASNMLGMTIQTYQTGGMALPVNEVLITEAAEIKQELYLSLLVDRANKCLSFVVSAAGGVDIEEVARTAPEKIHAVTVDNLEGLFPYECRKVGFSMGLTAKQTNQLTKIMMALHKMFHDLDLALVEVNPLIIDGDDDVVALDAKISMDDNALFRHKKLAELRDKSQEDPAEAEAHEHSLNYIKLDGNIACMVNGAGLAMATMDVIKLTGGEPANFLDVGGGATAERVAVAFKIILSDPNVKSILVNIFGGIVRCDLIAQGIIDAIKEVGVEQPIIVRLEGTNVEQGKELLKQSGLAVIAADDLDDAATKAVSAVA
ncbi:MAG TPA: ADP-forming succinate--CoA ligase subunit beta [Gammaproteobacteria bacterium]|nr:ADP-forming succinate--CoA ligase subunit beta [Xanthomonadales bacterium]MCB1594090.1 ADP-forming succinate--CoA ligase subunit beta [Xanthomonadales bacterium]HOP22292.1 ADP-forming succinate--CoA ligase subunit beta [Gammaproteobacteria bacterium]HPI95956.1 ADP-forming succinate--CoA ligase subunit beta [Gammaproteobacteria bacterium]HPQ87411.1 ADP-forming succinate--CoA ligase subunit beta [Gammaproteobacteria bacterium]